METISSRLVAARGNISRDTVSTAINISVSALAMYETGKRVPRDEIKIALANYYGRTVQELFF